MNTPIDVDGKNKEQVENVDDVQPKQGLIVFVHGLHPFGPKKTAYQELETLLKEQLPDCVFHLFEYDGSYISSADAGALAVRLENDIQKQSQHYKRIYLVGYSFGALLVRQAVLNAAKQVSPPDWLSKVERLFLLAGANRGFQPYSGVLKFLAWIAELLQRLPSWLSRLRLGRLSSQGLRGSEWVTQLRMGWVEQSVKADSLLPFTVQILGESDSLVGSHDSTDIATSRNSLELKIDNVGHRDLALLNTGSLERVGPGLAKKLREGLDAKPSESMPSFEDKRVVFLIHGIRDFAEWHEDLAESILKAAVDRNLVEIVPITYGYFSALQFLFSKARKRCARTILDLYVQYNARYPNARFSAVAHSNGAYALALALTQNHFVEIENILLAGSVLPRHFPWEDVQGRVTLLRNDCANADWPVGALCWVLSWLPFWCRRRDGVGAGGLDGFEGDVVYGSPKGGKTFVNNYKFHKGGHFAALEPNHHEEVAQFLLTGEHWSKSNPEYSKKWLRLFFFRLLVVFVATACGAAYWAISVYSTSSSLAVLCSAAWTLIIVSILLLI